MPDNQQGSVSSNIEHSDRDEEQIRQQRYFRDLFREARAKAQQNAEDFQDILFALEKLGVTLAKPQKARQASLGNFETAIKNLVANAPLAQAQKEPWHIPFNKLYNLVRNYRNDALHQGAVARNLTSRAVHLALIIEEALMSNNDQVQDFMVANVITAQSWQPLSIIRQQMLENSFSYLPYYDSNQDKWCLIADYQIAKYTRADDEAIQQEQKTRKNEISQDPCKKKSLTMSRGSIAHDIRIQRLSKSLAETLENGEFEMDEANTCYPNASIDDILKKATDKPHVVIDKNDPSRIYGIVTAFDLL